jgi:hypothetical protein
MSGVITNMTDLNDILTEKAVKQWAVRIEEKLDGSAAVFEMEEDYYPSEQEWIREVLVPRLCKAPYNLNAQTVYSGPPDKSCPCPLRDKGCTHRKGRKLIVTLRPPSTVVHDRERPPSEIESDRPQKKQKISKDKEDSESD